MNAIINIYEDSKWPVFDPKYALELKSEYPEIWVKGGGSVSDYANTVLLDIIDNGGIAETPEQVEILEMREAYLNRQAKNLSVAGDIGRVKWLGTLDSESIMKKSINQEVSRFHQRSEWIETKSAKLRDPKGGLTAAGRKHFKKKEGANLKPGVKGPANTPEKMRRKGSFLTRFFTNPSGPMTDEKGRPTRLALSAAAWGEPVPKNAADAAKLAAKGRRMLERYERTKKKK
jgi:hypothetical protein